LQPRAEGRGIWEFSIGSDYSSGTYGAARATRVYFVPLGIVYRTGRWRFAADSGVLRVKGPVDYASILDLTPEEVSDFGLDADDVSVSGAADTALSVAYGIYENFDQLLFVDIGARVKLPTASRTKGLGNGKVAGDLQVDMIKLLGRWSLLGSVSYTFRHPERGTRHAPAASVGVGRTLTDSTSLGAIYEWRGSPDRRAKDGRDVIAYLSHRLSDRVSVTAYGVHSLVSTGAQTQAGVRFTFRWR
ncbi:MAG: hypothetical protein Q8N51_20795, partial [Gammaproteobacteria bacterium]|nr:hypothetical protein [Gammaproteobacteria bacterium]